MNKLETFAREYAEKVYPIQDDYHEGIFVFDELYPKDYRYSYETAFKVGWNTRQLEIDELKQDTLKLIEDVYNFAGRPTKDGAKLLREAASQLEDKLKK